MKINIDLNTDAPLSDHDKRILRTLADDGEPVHVNKPLLVEQPAPTDDPVVTEQPQSDTPIDDPVVTEQPDNVLSLSDDPPPTLDKNELPWDKRIHATVDGRGKLTGKGVWQKRRGVDDATVTAVTAELKGEIQQPAADPVQAQQPVTSVFEQQPANSVIPQQPAPQKTMNGVVTPVDNPPPPINSVSFPELTMKIGERQQKNPQYGQIVQGVLAEFNLQALPALITNQDLIPQFNARLDELWQE